MSRIAIFVALVFTCRCFASFYDKEHYRGYYFFDDDMISETTSNSIPETPREASLLMQQKKQELYELRCLAILNPTVDHLKNYIQKHKETLTLSSHFTTEWAHTLLENSQLGAKISNPRGICKNIGQQSTLFSIPKK